MQLPWAMNNPFAKADRAATAPAAAPAKPGNTEEPDLNNLDPSKKTSNNKNPNPNDPNGSDPLADLASLWQPNVDKDGKVIQEDTGDTGPLMPVLDSAKLDAMIQKMNFTDGITKEELDAIKTGGEESVGAFMNMVNRAGRQAFHRSFAASSKLAEQGLTKAQERFMKNIPTHVRDMMVDSGLGDATPLTNNPMFKPLVQSVKNQYMKKFPKASPQEVSAGVQKYFQAMEAEFTKTKKDPNAELENDPSRKLRVGAADADFEAWLGDEINTLGQGGMFQGKQTQDE